MGGSYREGPQKGLLMRNPTTKGQQEKQEKDGRTSSRGMHSENAEMEDTNWRGEWRHLLREARAQKGLYRHAYMGGMARNEWH
jgi:hypothetical protein